MSKLNNNSQFQGTRGFATENAGYKSHKRNRPPKDVRMSLRQTEQNAYSYWASEASVPIVICTKPFPCIEKKMVFDPQLAVHFATEFWDAVNFSVTVPASVRAFPSLLQAATAISAAQQIASAESNVVGSPGPYGYLLLESPLEIPSRLRTMCGGLGASNIAEIGARMRFAHYSAEILACLRLAGQLCPEENYPTTEVSWHARTTDGQRAINSTLMPVTPNDQRFLMHCRIVLQEYLNDNDYPFIKVGEDDPLFQANNRPVWYDAVVNTIPQETAEVVNRVMPTAIRPLFSETGYDDTEGGWQTFMNAANNRQLKRLLFPRLGENEIPISSFVTDWRAILSKVLVKWTIQSHFIKQSLHLAGSEQVTNSGTIEQLIHVYETGCDQISDPIVRLSMPSLATTAQQNRCFLTPIFSRTLHFMGDNMPVRYCTTTSSSSIRTKYFMQDLKE